jgi:hypothetical protein
MRYISFFTHEDRGVPPTQEEIAKMGKLIEEGTKAGWLVVTEGVQSGSQGIRVQSTNGKVTVVDGPFAEAKEVIGGYAILRANSKEEVIELCRKFLAVAGGGTCELHPLFEMPASGGSR